MKPAVAEPEIVTKNGKPISVILPIKRYQEMIERLEDADDGAVRAVFAFVEPAQPVKMTKELVRTVDEMHYHTASG